MSTIQTINVNQIDPNSSVNVRQQGVDENVEKVKSSIDEHGYWPDQPIIVRSHPDSKSEYDYENVTGQCRLKACLALGLKSIPAFVLKLNDDEAIQRSWLENEIRGDLTFSEKAYWTEKIFNKYKGEGKTQSESYELTAKYLGRSPETIRGYYGLINLPEDLMQEVDQGTLKKGIAETIARVTYDPSDVEKSQEIMRERAVWWKDLDRDRRQQAPNALKDLGNRASITDLNKEVEKRALGNKRTIPYTIPSELYDDLLQWGQERGLDDEQSIVNHMVVDALKN